MGFGAEKQGQETWIVDDNGTHVATMSTSLGPKATADYAVRLAAEPPDLTVSPIDVTGGTLTMALDREDDDDGIPDDTT